MEWIFAALGIGAIVAAIVYVKNKKSFTRVPAPTPGFSFAYSGAAGPTGAMPGYFDFPSADGPHYVQKAAGPMAVGQTVTMEFSIQGDHKVVSSQDGGDAMVTLFFQRKGDNLSGKGAYQQYRYWGGTKSEPLTPGDHTVALQLTPEGWGDVLGSNGAQHPAEFAACVQNAAVIGFTFGNPGAGATGHGAHVKDGTVRFTLKRFEVA